MKPPPFRSAMPGVHWPAFPQALGMMTLALQYELERSQWWPAAKLRAQQFRQLGQLVDHAARSSPFHRDRLRAAGYRPGAALDDAIWQAVPLLTRHELQQRSPALRCAPPPAHGDVTHTRTSGSTGKPVEVATTSLAAMIGEAVSLRDHVWHGRDLGGNVAAIRRPRADEKTGERAPVWSRGLGAAFVTGTSALFDAMRPVAEQLDWLAAENPDYLITYPSNLRALLRRARALGVRPPRLKAVMTLGEAVPDGLAGELDAIWGIALEDVYSAVEAGIIALRCPDSDLYHVQSELSLVEVLDRAGRPCRAGETGRVVLTPLHNFAQPLLRYDIGDFAEVADPCPCGRGLPTLRRIVGRATSMLVLPSGDLIHPHLSGPIMGSGLPVVQYQIVQRSRERIEARLVVERPLVAAEEDLLRARLSAALGGNFAIEFSYPAEIARGEGGKYEDILCELRERA